MWYFTIRQAAIDRKQYQYMQQLAELTEVEIFNEPYENYCVFEVETERYQQMMDYADKEGIIYSLSASRPGRDELLAGMS